VGYHKGTLGVLKLFEYMMAGIPVVATDFELWKEIVEGEDCGLCVNPHDVQAIAKAVNYLIDNPDRARLMGENGRKAVRDKYNWATQEQALYGLYDSLVNR
jgi:glycosyltransferase involved in cell wall biosynthesis